MLALSTLTNPIPMSELERIGVNFSDPIDVFWRVFGERMKVSLPEAAECAPKISREVAQYGVITVGGMSDLELHEMEECIFAGGGSKKWAKQVQRLLGTQFKDTDPIVASTTARPPASAALAEPKTQQPHIARFPDEDLGDILNQNGTLHMCVVPKEELLAAVKETKDYTHTVLSPKDTNAVMDVCWNYIFKQYGNIRNSKILFEHLIPQLDATQGGLFAGLHCQGKCDLYTKFRYRWKAGRKPNYRPPELDSATITGMCDAAKQLVLQNFKVNMKVEDETSNSPLLPQVMPAAEAAAEAAKPPPPPPPGPTAAQLRKPSQAEKSRALQQISTNVAAHAAALPQAHVPPPPAAAPPPPSFGTRVMPLPVQPAALPAKPPPKAKKAKTAPKNKKAAAAPKAAAAKRRAQVVDVDGDSSEGDESEGDDDESEGDDDKAEGDDDKAEGDDDKAYDVEAILGECNARRARLLP